MSDFTDQVVIVTGAGHERFGRLDAVVGNAGIFHTASFDEVAGICTRLGI